MECRAPHSCAQPAQPPPQRARSPGLLERLQVLDDLQHGVRARLLHVGDAPLHFLPMPSAPWQTIQPDDALCLPIQPGSMPAGRVRAIGMCTRVRAFVGASSSAAYGAARL